MREERTLLDLGSDSIFLDKDQYGSLWLRIGMNHPGNTRLARIEMREMRQLAIALLMQAERMEDEREQREFEEALEKLTSTTGLGT